MNCPTPPTGELPTCCQFHGLADGCNQGDDCPARKPVGWHGHSGLVTMQGGKAVDTDEEPTEPGFWSAITNLCTWAVIAFICAGGLGIALAFGLRLLGGK